MPARGRPTRGRPPATGRQERYSAREENDDDDNKKLTGPIKKRPVLLRGRPPAAASTPIRRGKKANNSPDQDLSNYLLATARSRRTPKPNPKYQNDDVVTPKGKRGGRGDGSDDEDDGESGEGEDFDGNDSSEHELEEEEESSDDEEYRVTRRRPGRSAKTSPQAEAKLLRSQQQQAHQQQQQAARKRAEAAEQQQSMSKIKALQEIRRRRIELEKKESSLLARNKRLNLDMYDASDSDVSISGPSKKLIRIERPPPKGTFERQIGRTTLTALKSDAASPRIRLNMDPGKLKQTTSTESKTRTVFLTRQPLTAEEIKQRQASLEKLQQQGNRSTATPSPRQRVASPASGGSQAKQRVSSPMSAPKAPDSSSGQKPRLEIAKKSAEDAGTTAVANSGDENDSTTGPTTTIDDFETMPTFTIVNINDIMNKKTDALIEKMPGRSVRDSDDEDRVYPPQAARNRRKTMHTTILSDKVDASKLSGPAPKSPFPLRKPPTIMNSKMLMSGESTKSTPRILNSVLAKKAKTSAEKLHSMSGGEEDEVHRPHRTFGHQAKENLFGNKQPGTTAMQRKLPGEKVLVQRQGNKLIKKITCYETWYVISMPQPEFPPPKSILNMSMIYLGNNMKRIDLPSDEWSYKITLQRRNTALPTNEIYTGEIQDPNINEAEKKNYIPCNIMFRRATHNTTLRIQFDRAVIFKNKCFYTNIDGKNVRLLGAPQHINDIDDIEILLQIIDDISLLNPCVEQTSIIV